MLQPLSSISGPALRLALPLLLIFWLLLSGWAAAAKGSHSWQNTPWLECADTQPPQDEDNDDPDAGIADQLSFTFHSRHLSQPRQGGHPLRPGHGDPAARAPPGPSPV